MDSLTTDAKICIERSLNINNAKIEIGDLVSRFDILQTCKWITNNDFKKVCLQFPDELLEVSADIYEEIKERTTADLYILGDTSYASCCVDSVAAMHIQGDAVIHYGHTCFTKTNIPVFIVLPKTELDLGATMTSIIEKFKPDKYDKLCLFYGAEYAHYKDEIMSSWFDKYPLSYMAVIEMDNLASSYLGRVIRNKRNEEYSLEATKDCVCIYMGTRGETVFNFTISIPANKWYIVDPNQSSISNLEETKWFKRRRFLVEKCKDANIIGILICKLAGDQTKDIINRMKQVCKVNRKKSYIVSVGKPNVAKLANFPEIDIYVMIACPENELYSCRDFYKPIVYPFELEMALNSNRDPYYDYHVTDYDKLLPGRRHHCEVDLLKEETDVSLITGNIRGLNIERNIEHGSQVSETHKGTLANIGKNLQERSWKGLEQKLGETEVQKVEEGRMGIPLQYRNEPE